MTAINSQFEVILGALPGIARKAASWPRGGRSDALVDRRRTPGAGRHPGGRLPAARRPAGGPSIVPSVNEITRGAAAASKDLDAAALLLTTQDQVSQTVAGAANYGGSLDVIIDDAEEERRHGGAGPGTADRGLRDHPGARLLPGLDHPRAPQDHQRTRRDHRQRDRDRRQDRPRSTRWCRRSTPTWTPASTCSRRCWSRRPAWRTPSAWSTACTRARPRRLRNFPESTGRARRGSPRSTPRDAHAGPARPGGADRHGQPGRRGAARRAGLERVGRQALPRRPKHAAGAAAALTGDRGRLPDNTSSATTSGSRASGCPRPPERVVKGAPRADPGSVRLRAAASVEGAIASSSGSVPRRGSSPAATACCR